MIPLMKLEIRNNQLKPVHCEPSNETFGASLHCEPNLQNDSNLSIDQMSESGSYKSKSSDYDILIYEYW